MKSALLCVLTLLILTSPAQAGKVLDSLSAAEREKVATGQPVIRIEEVADSAWPRVTVIAGIGASAEEAAAVFHDYELQREYLPDLKKSHVERRLDRRTAEVAFTLDLPIVSDENYTTRNRVFAGNGSDFGVIWEFVRADSARHIEGFVRFERLPRGSLFAYSNFVVPSASGGMASRMRGRAINLVVGAAEAFARQVARETERDPRLLERQIQELRAALAR